MHGAYIGDNKLLISTVWKGMLYTYGDDFSLTPNLLINGVFDVPLTNFFNKKFASR